MIDLLSEISIEVPCHVCSSSYFVPADVVRESQRLLAEGCPGTSSHECAPLHLATLLPARALEHLAMALDEIEEGAKLRGARSVSVDRTRAPSR
jgi:hypothetical protein